VAPRQGKTTATTPLPCVRVTATGGGGAEGVLARSVYRRENRAGNAASPET